MRRGFDGLARTLAIFACAAAAGACSDSSSKSNGNAPGGGEGALRCGDFMTKSEVTALGLDATDYDEDKTQTSSGLGVLCRMGSVLATIFHGDDFSSMVGGLDDAVTKGTLVASDGASIGKESHWATLAPEHEVIFLATSGKYAANVTSRDAMLVEQVAKALDAKF